MSVNKCKDDITTNPGLTAMFRIRSRFHVVRDPVINPVIGAWQVSLKEGIILFFSGEEIDIQKNCTYSGKPRNHPAVPHASPRRKIGLIVGNAKCRHLKILTCKGTLRQVFICLRPRTLYPPPPHTHTYSQQGGGGGGLNQNG
jgi:hypothetical protein